MSLPPGDTTPNDDDEDDDDFFSTTNLPSYSQLLSQLRRSALTPHNRLASIHADAAFIARVATAFSGGSLSPSSSETRTEGDKKRRRRPLVANERCGSWYIPPERKEGSAYFKSTDGHERAWKFSTRRLNLQLIEMVERNDGIIIVDSTRRGKRMPDALSTTIPIWCTVLNLALLPSHPLSSNLFLPPYFSASTHAQITALIPSFLESLKELKLTLPTCLTKPLRPLWITQESTLPEQDNEEVEEEVEENEEEGEGKREEQNMIFEDYRPVICCTASRRVIGSEVDEGGYVQGAGDDTENWAMGLTPDIFWANASTLLSASETDLQELIIKLVEQKTSFSSSSVSSNGAATRKRLTPSLSVCALPLSLPPNQETECFILLTQATTTKESWVKSSTCMQVGLGKHKTASRNLRLALPDICAFAAKFLQDKKLSPLSALNEEKGNEVEKEKGNEKEKEKENESTPQIVVACESGKDLSVGTALALSCYLFDDGGQFRVPDGNASFTKTLVKVRLGGIMTVFPEANPNRNTLQSVNSFLMDWRR